LNGLIDATRQNPLGMLFGPIVVLAGLTALWFWLRRKNRAGGDAVAVIIAAIAWVAAMLFLFAKSQLSPTYKKLVGLGVTLGCWWVFNWLNRLGSSDDSPPQE
jgi:uncharacterized membrane protein